MKVRAIGASALGPDVQMQQAPIGGAQEMMVGLHRHVGRHHQRNGAVGHAFLFNTGAGRRPSPFDGPIGSEGDGQAARRRASSAFVYRGERFPQPQSTASARSPRWKTLVASLRVMQKTSTWTASLASAPTPFRCRSELFGALETKTPMGRRTPSTPSCPASSTRCRNTSVTNHAYSPWVMMASKKWWDTLSKRRAEGADGRRQASRDFERSDTCAEAAKAVGRRPSRPRACRS